MTPTNTLTLPASTATYPPEPRFPTLKVRGGPEGYGMTVELNGRMIPATHITLEAGVTRVAVATIELYVVPDVDAAVDEVR